MNLREKTVIFSYAMVNLGISKNNFNYYLTYKNTSTGFIGGFTIQIMHSALKPPTTSMLMSMYLIQVILFSI
jgi:hypothetical protein